MGDKTGIEWTDATWNPVTGCTKVSQGCKHCYAERIFARPYPGRAFTDVRCHDDRLDLPLRWRRPRRIFVNSMSDLFHDDVPESFIDRVFAVVVLAPQHSFQILTKRALRMRDYMAEGGRGAQVLDYVRNSEIGYIAHGERLPPQSWPPRNAWLGVSCEDQATADERIPLLLQTPAAVRWISAEPLLGPVDLARIKIARGLAECAGGQLPRIDWVVVGGESGPKARPMHPDWARSLRDQCVAAGVPFLFKQWGEWAPGECAGGPMRRTEQHATWWDGSWQFGAMTPSQGAELHRDDEPDLWRVGKRAAGRLLDGREWDEYPRDAVQGAER